MNNPAIEKKVIPHKCKYCGCELYYLYDYILDDNIDKNFYYRDCKTGYYYKCKTCKERSRGQEIGGIRGKE